MKSKGEKIRDAAKIAAKDFCYYVIDLKAQKILHGPHTIESCQRFVSDRGAGCIVREGNLLMQGCERDEESSS